MPKRISEIFGVSEDDLKKEGVLHGFINLDSVFYVDPPHLLENTKISELENSYIHFKKYFSEIVHVLENPKTSEDRFLSTAHKKLIFPELSFVVPLGFSIGENPVRLLSIKLHRVAVHCHHQALQWVQHPFPC
jgi:hypothetical protein